jgi:hypothetical protein
MDTGECADTQRAELAVRTCSDLTSRPRVPYLSFLSVNSVLKLLLSLMFKLYLIFFLFKTSVQTCNTISYDLLLDKINHNEIYNKFYF